MRLPAAPHRGRARASPVLLLAAGGVGRRPWRDGELVWFGLWDLAPAEGTGLVGTAATRLVAPGVAELCAYAMAGRAAVAGAGRPAACARVADALRADARRADLRQAAGGTTGSGWRCCSVPAFRAVPLHRPGVGEGRTGRRIGGLAVAGAVEMASGGAGRRRRAARGAWRLPAGPPRPPGQGRLCLGAARPGVAEQGRARQPVQLGFVEAPRRCAPRGPARRPGPPSASSGLPAQQVVSACRPSPHGTRCSAPPSWMPSRLLAEPVAGGVAMEGLRPRVTAGGVAEEGARNSRRRRARAPRAAHRPASAASARQAR
jgi:hypothetical protein